MRVVVVGDALIDELRDDRGVREFVGGAALNVAIGLTRLGVPATLIAMVGDDEPGDHIRRYLHDYGVDLLASPSPRGSSRAVSTRSGGEPVYVFNEAAQHRAIVFGDAERQACRDADLIVVSCFPFDDPDQVAALAAAVGDTPLAIDPNPRTGMMRDFDEFVRGFERLAAHARLVKIGEDDAALLYREPLDAVSDRLRDLGAEVVLATYGSAGAALDATGVAVTAPIAKLPGRIVDTMGAGDAVLSAIAASLVQDAPEDEDEWGAALHRAMDVAGSTCRFEGALLRLPSALDSEELEHFGS